MRSDDIDDNNDDDDGDEVTDLAARSIPFRYTRRDNITILIVLAGERFEGSGVNLVGSTALLSTPRNTSTQRRSAELSGQDKMPCQ